MLRFSIRQHEKDPPALFEDALGAAMVAGVEDEGERHLEDLGHLKRVGDRAERAARTMPTTGVISNPVPVT